MMTEWERMLSGGLYSAADPELLAARDRARTLTRAFNDARTEEERQGVLRELLGGMGGDIYIEPTFRCDYGKNIFLGSRFYANYDCVFLDVARIDVGDDVLLGPRVCLFTAGHPVDPQVRSRGLEYGKPIRIESRVWIGGNSVLCPGVTVGEGAIIGAGAVVTRDIPGHVLAAGNPCRVLRPLTDEDRAHWEALEAQYRAEH